MFSLTQDTAVHDNGFKIVTTGVLDSQVGVNECTTSSGGKVLVLPVGNMETGLWVTELFQVPGRG